jgi:putative transposase
MLKKKCKSEILEPEKYYHIFNRANGNEKLFVDETDYNYFLSKFERYILPIADLITYCLIPNHFHFFVRILNSKEIYINLQLNPIDSSEDLINQSFSNFFNSYTKSYNLRHNRKGKLFMLPYKRILVEDDSYFISIINYIHRNPLHHGLVKNHTDWKYSSYAAYLSHNKTKINRELGLELYGSLENFLLFHQENRAKEGFEKFLKE